jgi:hypothetical protein
VPNGTDIAMPANLNLICKLSINVIVNIKNEKLIGNTLDLERKRLLKNFNFTVA